MKDEDLLLKLHRLHDEGALYMSRVMPTWRNVAVAISPLVYAWAAIEERVPLSDAPSVSVDHWLQSSLKEAQQIGVWTRAQLDLFLAHAEAIPRGHILQVDWTRNLALWKIPNLGEMPNVSWETQMMGPAPSWVLRLQCVWAGCNLVTLAQVLDLFEDCEEVAYSRISLQSQGPLIIHCPGSIAKSSRVAILRSST